MLKKIFRFASFLALTIFMASTTIFSGANPVFASQMGTEINEDNSMGIVIEESRTWMARKQVLPQTLEMIKHFLLFQVLVKIPVKTDYFLKVLIDNKY